jgi:molecular chaperone DnaK (HSP70)
VNDCALIVPTYYTNEQRTLIKQCAQLAGLNPLLITDDLSAGIKLFSYLDIMMVYILIYDHLRFILL